MNQHTLSVREITQSDIPHLVAYWMDADKAHLLAMGADPDKMPTREYFTGALTQQVQQAYTEKQSYCIIWEVDGQPVGHCNVNMITFGEAAHIHLHIWKPGTRNQGMGTPLVKLSLPYFFNNLQLQVLYCEPYALNPAPNKTLEKVGFTFEKEYITTPGSINFEQPVKRWSLTYEDFKKRI